MAGRRAGLRASCALAALALSGLLVSSAGALEFAEGRVQIHGFGEEQVRALDRSFKEELDLAQWYNVLNVEMEFDIAPDGFGPVDLLEAFVRVEARYDCIWSRGCGMFPSVNTYGDRAKRLPKRLRSAEDRDFAGAIEAYLVTLRAADVDNGFEFEHTQLQRFFVKLYVDLVRVLRALAPRTLDSGLDSLDEHLAVDVALGLQLTKDRQ